MCLSNSCVRVSKITGVSFLIELVTVGLLDGRFQCLPYKVGHDRVTVDILELEMLLVMSASIMAGRLLCK
jgi:hypothetical protein